MMSDSSSSIPSKNKTLTYFLICSVIWGLTWIAIKFQINAINGSVAVFYRFFFASLVMFGLCFLNRENLKYSPKMHFRFFSQGFFCFV
jgi:drug/metabolite transporter (DMT)-like permease